MKIFRNGVAIYDLTIDFGTVIKRRVMVENTLNLSVNTPKDEAPVLQIGDYTEVDGERYTLLDDAEYTLKEGVYEIRAVLCGPLHMLELWMMPDIGTEEFFYYGAVTDQINHVMAALNSKDPGWTAVLPDVNSLAHNEPKNINYAGVSILSAFHAVCNPESGYALEFDITRKQITFARQIRRAAPFGFEYGLGKGLYSVTRGKLTDGTIFTRVFGYGGTTNMPLNQRLSFAVGNQPPYVERKVERYGLRETRVNFDHIYPRRNSAITSDGARVEAGKVNWTVADSSMNFDLNAQIVDKATIVFNSGDCAGSEFEIVAYDPVTKTITFKELTQDEGAAAYTLPNDSRYPHRGDAYVFVNILMPDEYIIAARAELLAATEAEADRLSAPRFPYSVECDPRHFKTLGVRPAPGDECRIVDAPMNVDTSTRIVGIEYPVLAPLEVKLTLSDNLLIPASVQLVKTVNNLKTQLSMLDRGNITEQYLRQIFHPLGGSPNLDFQTRDLSSRDITARIGRLRDLFASGSVGSADFMSGLLGTGWNISTSGAGEMDSLILRTFLSTPELVKNQIRIIGSEAWLTENGVVATVRANPFLVTGRVNATGQRLGTRWTGDYFVSFHDENSNKWFRYDDILRGIYNFDDGFRTVYLRVVRELGNGYILRPLNGLAPTAEMVLARQGNFSDPARQGSIYLNSAEAYIRVLGSMNSTAITNANLVAQLGNLRGLRVDGVTLPADGLYAPGLAVDARNVAGLSAMFNVLEGEISSKVSNGDFSSYVTQTAEEFEVVAKEIKLKADKTTIDGLLTVNGQIRADKIDTDSLVAKRLDTRNMEDPVFGQRGFVFEKGLNNMKMYDSKGLVTGIISASENRPNGVMGEMILSYTKGDMRLTPNNLTFKDTNGNEVLNFGRDGIKLPPGAHMDMPGVLAAGRVSSGGGMVNQWGCKTCSCVKYNGQAGKYKILHDIGHNNYFVNVTPVSNGNWTKVHGAILEKTTTYVVVGIFDSGYDNTTIDYDFEFMICGRN